MFENSFSGNIYEIPFSKKIYENLFIEDNPEPIISGFTNKKNLWWEQLRVLHHQETIPLSLVKGLFDMDTKGKILSKVKQMD